MAAAPDTSALLYDAECRFCRWSLAWVLRSDRRQAVRPVALQTGEALKLLGPMGEAERMRSWHLVAPDGRTALAGAAAAPLARLLPGGRGPAALLGLSPSLVERAYECIARHRSSLSRPLSRGAIRRADELIAARERATAGTDS